MGMFFPFIRTKNGVENILMSIIIIIIIVVVLVMVFMEMNNILFNIHIIFNGVYKNITHPRNWSGVFILKIICFMRENNINKNKQIKERKKKKKEKRSRDSPKLIQ